MALDSRHILEAIAEEGTAHFIDRCRGHGLWSDPEKIGAAEVYFRKVLLNEIKADSEMFEQFTRKQKRDLQKELILAIVRSEAAWNNLRFPNFIFDTWFAPMAGGLSQRTRVNREEMPPDLGPDEVREWLIEKEQRAFVRFLRLRILGKRNHFKLWMQGYNQQIAYEASRAFLRDEIIDLRAYLAPLLPPALCRELCFTLAFYCSSIKQVPLRIDDDPWFKNQVDRVRLSAQRVHG